MSNALSYSRGMSSDSNKKARPATLWKTLKGKNVKTNDGKDLGEIKEISDNYVHVQKGNIHKDSFWIPKYVADAYDGKTLWLLIDEGELRSRYQYGKESMPSKKKISMEKILKSLREHRMAKKEAMIQSLIQIFELLRTTRILEI